MTDIETRADAPAKTKLVIFDHDMTIVDSSDAIMTGMNGLAKVKGLRPVSKEEVRRGIALPIIEAFEDLWGTSDPSWPEIYRQSVVDLEYKLIKPYPDTIPTLSELKSRGVKLAVASNRQKPSEALGNTNLLQYFDSVVGLLDGVAPKPSPEMLNLLMQRFNVTRAETVYVGDALVDIQAAVSAKVRGVGVTTGNYGSADLIAAGAWKSIDNLRELIGCLTF